ncbi:MAG: hypothetical protein ACJ8C4_02290 [Gemmataceae bacterium]
MAAFLARQGTTGVASTSCSGIEPYDAVPSQAVDSVVAWEGAFEALTSNVSSVKPPKRIPEVWSTLVAALPSALALPMAVGNFPQAVRDLPALLQVGPAAAAGNRPAMIDETAISQFLAKSAASDDPVSWFLAVGMARMTGDYEKAEQLIQAKQSMVPPHLSDAWANERATVLWERGFFEQAVPIWYSLPDSAPVLFNRGVAELVGPNVRFAAKHFKAAVAMLAESSGWHHLGRLYLAIAESR